MAIYMRSGKTGTGKSNDAVKFAFQQWRQGRDIVSNTPLFFTTFNKGFSGENIVDNKEYFSYYERFIITTFQKIFCKIFRKEYIPLYRGKIKYFDTLDEVFHLKNCTILFDEGQTAFRNYDWESIPRLFLYKLEQNRKHGLDMVTTAQRVKAVNINYRELIQDWAHFETIIDIFGFHIYRKKQKDIDYITENMQEDQIPNLKIWNWKILVPWGKRLYDTFYDIGFEPLQKYTIYDKNKKIHLILESGMTVKQALAQFKLMENLRKLESVYKAKDESGVIIRKIKS